MNPIKAISSFIEASKRVFIVSRKPDWKEFNTMVKVTGVGILIIGIIGFFIILFFTITQIGG